MEHEKYSYVEALRYLAALYNVEIEETQVSEEQKQQFQTADSLYVINEYARKFFHEQLMASDEGRDIGLTYLKERGFREEVINTFQIGYDPLTPPDSFAKAAINDQYNKELLVKSGLIKERDGIFKDNYRGRIIFPISNRSGKTIGFGARIIKSNDRSPKYINTPENEIYVKSRILYGLYQARHAIDKADECLLVEGYLDVVSLHQAGFENVVAAGGTSITSEQLQQIKKFTSNCTILLDGDAAGVKAALRTIDLGLDEGLNIKVVLIPDGEDPDSYVHKIGAPAFEEFIKQKKLDFIQFQAQALMPEAGEDPYKRSEVVNKIAFSVSKFNRPQEFTIKQDFIRRASQLLKIEEGGFRDLVNQLIRQRFQTEFKPGEGKQDFQSSVPSKIPADPGEASTEDDNPNFETEKTVIAALLEFGLNDWDEQTKTADYIFSSLEEDELESCIENKLLQAIYHDYKTAYLAGEEPGFRSMIYPESPEKERLVTDLRTGAPEISHNWNKFYSGKIESREDLFREEILSSITYLKVRKVKKMMAENEEILKNAANYEDVMIALETQKALKELEKSLLEKAGTVIIK